MAYVTIIPTIIMMMLTVPSLSYILAKHLTVYKALNPIISETAFVTETLLLPRSKMFEAGPSPLFSCIFPS